MDFENEDDFLEHFGVKGMKWGVRKKVRGTAGRADRLQRQAARRPTRGNVRSAQRAQKVADRSSAKKSKTDLKVASKMSKGEKFASFVAGGPIGMMVYKGGKISLAKHDLETMSPKQVADKQKKIKALAKMSTGEKVASAILLTPAGMVAYKGGKIVGARISVNNRMNRSSQKQ